jgi:uncharacterized BrkB/YihY/UPF0761 family membrane protein
MALRDGLARRRAQLDDARARVPGVEHAVRFQSRSAGVGASLLACAIAYRLFLWMLPMSLVLVSLAAIVGGRDGRAAADVAGEMGLSAYVTGEVATQAHPSRWFGLAVGLVATVPASVGAGKTLRAVHQIVWDVPVDAREKRNSLAVGAGFLGFGLALIATAGLAAFVRARSTDAGIAATVAASFLFGALWFVVSAHLPHRDAPTSALLPGAVLVVAAILVLHLVTTYYLLNKLESASELYGALGGAASVLLWLYFLGHIVVGSAIVNASLWERDRVTSPGAGHLRNHPGSGDSHDGPRAEL